AAVADEHLAKLHLHEKVSRACYWDGMRDFRALVVALLCLVACSGKKADDVQRTDRPKTPAKREPQQPVATPEQPVPAGPDFPAGTRSLELVRTVGVRIEPADDAKRIGTIAIDTRVGWQRVADGKGCQKPWVEVKPR